MQSKRTRLEFRIALLALLLFAGGTAVAEPIPAQRRAELTNLLLQDCGSCHGLTLKGGLGPALLPERLAERSDADLIAVILDGTPGTPMPPWRPELSDADAAWLVRTMKEGLPK